MPVSGTSQSQSATIAAGASESTVIDAVGSKLMGIIMPAAWTAADITFLVCDTENGTFRPLHDDLKVEAKITSPAVNEAYALDTLAGVLAPWRFIKLRSGTKAAAVVQVAQAVIKVSLED